MLPLRRYRCRDCLAVLVVGPRGLIGRRWYSAGAISVAVAAFAAGETGAEARARTSPAVHVGGAAVDRWMTLVRWLDAARDGPLFGVPGLRGLGRRDVARQVVLVLAARAGHRPGAHMAESAFAGAAAAA